mgnify:CR=1 FL=1
MEVRHIQFIDKILKIFTNGGFGVEKFDDKTYDIIDRSIIGKAKIGSIKILDNGDISIKLGGEAKKHAKFNSIMKHTSLKAKPIHNVATVAKMVKDMLADYKSAKKIVYKESYETLSKNMLVEVTRDELEDAIDDYLTLTETNEIKVNYADLLTFVSDKLNITEDECEAKYGDVLNLSIDYDEDKYINTMDSIFAESEIKADFRKFLKENKIDDLMAEIKTDSALRRFRETPAYKNTDEEGKYRKLWKYIVGTYGSKFSQTEDLEDICRKIAAEDEDIF